MQRDAKQVLTESLVLAARGGDEGAFRDLHALWSPDLRRFALSRVERIDAAEELMTEVWLAIARGLRRLDDPACFARWAFRITERKSADWVRRRVRERKREAATEAAAAEMQPAAVVAAAQEPSDDVLELRTAIAGLPPEQRGLLQLFYQAERSVAEIAEILGIPPGTVKSRLFSVRETLRQKLEAKSHE